MADGIQIAIFLEVAEIAVTQFNGPPQSFNGMFVSLEQGVTASQIVMGQGIIGTEADQLFVNLQSLSITSLEGQVVALDPKYVHVIAITFQDTSKKINFKIQLVLISQANQSAAFGFGLRPLVGMLILL